MSARRSVDAASVDRLTCISPRLRSELLSLGDGVDLNVKPPRVVWFTRRAAAQRPHVELPAPERGALPVLRPRRGEGLVTHDDLTATAWRVGPRREHLRVELVECDGGASFESLHAIFDDLLPTEHHHWHVTADPAIIAEVSTLLATTWTVQP